MNSNDVDICVVHHGPANKLIDQLDSIKKFTKAHHRFMVVLDAPGQDVKDALRVWMGENYKTGHAKVVANSSFHGLSHCVRQAIELGQERPSEYVIIFHPGLIVNDREWLNKLSTPFKDTACAISYADPLAAPSSDLPRPIPRTQHPIEGLVMLRRPAPDDIVQTDPNHPWMHSAAAALKRSRRIYIVPWVRCSITKMPATKVKPMPKADSKAEVLISR